VDERLLETKQAFQNPQWYFQKLGYHVRVRLETIREFLSGSKFDRILDIGCGDGSISLPLLTQENRLTLLDMSEGMLLRARSRIPIGQSDRVDIVKGDFMSAQLDVNSYDLIICIGVMAYVDPVEPFLEKLDSLLKPGGGLVLEWTDGNHFISRLFRPYHRLMSVFITPKVRLTTQNSDDIVGRLKKLGFEAECSYRYCSPLPVVRRFLSENINYRLIRKMHGNVRRNRATWLGEECIFHFRKMSAQEQARSLSDL
jgi:ubiquinone/menaquinone biosynthesis C-methylase UbiE